MNFSAPSPGERIRMSTLPTTRCAWASPTAGRSRYLWFGFLGCSTQQRSNGTIGKSLLPVWHSLADIDEDLSSEGLLRGAPAAARRRGAA